MVLFVSLELFILYSHIFSIFCSLSNVKKKKKKKIEIICEAKMVSSFLVLKPHVFNSNDDTLVCTRSFFLDARFVLENISSQRTFGVRRAPHRRTGYAPPSIRFRARIRAIDSSKNVLIGIIPSGCNDCQLARS